MRYRDDTCGSPKPSSAICNDTRNVQSNVNTNMMYLPLSWFILLLLFLLFYYEVPIVCVYFFEIEGTFFYSHRGSHLYGQVGGRAQSLKCTAFASGKKDVCSIRKETCLNMQSQTVHYHKMEHWRQRPCLWWCGRHANVMCRMHNSSIPV